MLDDTVLDRFKAHQEECGQCWENPFLPCPAGAAIVAEIPLTNEDEEQD